MSVAETDGEAPVIRFLTSAEALRLANASDPEF